MHGFAQIAAGEPSGAGFLTDHLLNNTLGQAQSVLAAYYARGVVENPTLEAAQAIARGDLDLADAVAELMDKWDQANPMPGKAEWKEAADHLMVWDKNHWNWTGPDPLEVWEERRSQEEMRVGQRLDVLAERISGDLVDAPVAVVRPGTHPLVLQTLGIESDGLLSKHEINALLVGRHSSGEKIEGKHYAKERKLPVDPKDGRLRYSTPIGSYDFTVSPHKSISVAYAFSTGAEQAKIYNAFLEAARESTAYIGDHIGRARLGDGGKDGHEQGHVAFLEFVHTTARRVVSADSTGIKLDNTSPGDPDLHVHNLVPNVVVCDSGRLGSLDTAAISGLNFEADAFFHARLAQKLRDGGFATEIDPRTNAARMTEVPDALCYLFSKRTKGGEMIARHETEQRGEVWDELAPAQREARIKASTQRWDQRKDGEKDDVADVADWCKQAKDVCGWERESFYLYGPPAPELSVEQRHRVAYETALPVLAKTFEHESVITQFNIRAAAAVGLIKAGITDTKDIDAVTKIMREEGVQQYGEKTPVSWAQEPDKRRVSVTTGLHEANEREFITRMQGAAADKSGAIPADLLKSKLDTSGLDFASAHGQLQRQAIERVGTGGRFGLVVASAGAGKTTALRPMVAAWNEMQRDVHGVSLAWRQADDLVDAGIDRRNIKAFSVLMGALKAEADMTAKGLSEQQKDELVGGHHRRTILTENSVVAVDEVGLLGTRQGLELLRHRDKLGFTIVALGDNKQAEAIEAGDFLSLASRALGAEAIPVITSTVRQQTAREKEIVGLFREGRAAEALTMKRQDGTAELVYGAHAEVVQRVAKLYAERLTATGKAPTISAPTNNDAHQIGEAVRLERRAMGMLGPDLARVKATDGERNYSLALAAGDRVRLFKSTGADIAGGRGGTIGRNGSIVEVVNVTSDGIVLRGASGKVGTVTWDKLTRPDGRAHLAYGDAMTVHTAQGSTANEHIFALPAGSQAVNGRLGYTANTRHRHAAYIVTSETAERVAVSRSRPINDQREVTTDDKWANVAANLSYQPVRDTAMALFDRVGDVRRGAVRAFHGALAPGEQQQAVGQAPSMGHEHVHGHKISAGLTRDAAELIQRIAHNARAVVSDLKQRLAPARRPEPQTVVQRVQQQREAAEQHYQGPTLGR